MTSAVAFQTKGWGLLFQGEEAFHLIEPRTAGGGEVKIEVAVLSGFEPPLYGGALAR
jgi:hypothetical protein